MDSLSAQQADLSGVAELRQNLPTFRQNLDRARVRGGSGHHVRKEMLQELIEAVDTHMEHCRRLDQLCGLFADIRGRRSARERCHVIMEVQNMFENLQGSLLEWRRGHQRTPEDRDRWITRVREATASEDGRDRARSEALDREATETVQELFRAIMLYVPLTIQVIGAKHQMELDQMLEQNADGLVLGGFLDRLRQAFNYILHG